MFINDMMKIVKILNEALQKKLFFDHLLLASNEQSANCQK